MKLMNIEGTIDLLGEAHAHPKGRVYSHVSILTTKGDEVLAHNVCVHDSLADKLRLGVTGALVLQKTLFSTVLREAEIATAA